MADSTVLATMVIVFREALEAGLIVGIILTMLDRLRAMRYAPHVWVSVATAVAASGAAGWALSRLTAATQGRWQEFIEGTISIAACGVLTYMIWWMERQARRLRPEIEEHVEVAVGRQELSAIMLLPFLAVFREGAETVLFLQAVAIQNSGAVSWAGGLLGGGAAVVVTALLFAGGRRVPVKALFRWTGTLLLFMAAGLLAYGIHELEELGWLPPIIEHVWNINHVLDEKAGLGAFLKALFGYNGNPSLLEVIAYATYLTGALWLLRRGSPQPAAAERPTP